MKNLLSSVVAVAGLMRAPAFGHHSFRAEYDVNKLITVTGTITQVEWINPHGRFYVDVKEGENVTSWEFELGSPNGLMRTGWTRSTLKPGDGITVEGYQAKDGSHLGVVRQVKLADGSQWVNVDRWNPAMK